MQESPEVCLATSRRYMPGQFGFELPEPGAVVEGVVVVDGVVVVEGMSLVDDGVVAVVVVGVVAALPVPAAYALPPPTRAPATATTARLFLRLLVMYLLLRRVQSP